MIQENNGAAYAVTRKELFFDVVIGAADAQGNITNPEKEHVFFNANSGSQGLTDFDTNWPAADNTIPSHQTHTYNRIGFSAQGADGSPLTAKTLSLLARSVVTMKIGEQEVKKGQLSEFFKIPGAVSNALNADFFTGPSYKELQQEVAGPKAIIDFRVKVPANLGQIVRLSGKLDSVISARQ